MRSLLKICLPLVLMCACSDKKLTSGETPANQTLVGSWELREAQNGMMPTATYPPGNGSRWAFTENTFEEFREGTRVRNGSYTLVADASVSETVGLELPSGQFTHRLVFNQDTTEKPFIHLRADTLEMVQGFFPVDAGSRQVFVKVRE
jgi:hypothetical protein